MSQAFTRIKCANVHCPYIALPGRIYCCGACSNADAVGNWDYSLHSELMCDRERLVALGPDPVRTYGQDNFHKHLWLMVIFISVILIMLFGTIAAIGAK